MPKSKNKNFMITSSNGSGFRKTDTLSSGTEGEYKEKSISSLHSKIAQNEANIIALKERVESERNLKFWIVGIILTIVAGIFGGLTIYHSLIKDTQDAYRNLQNDYYKELINLRKEFQQNLK